MIITSGCATAFVRSESTVRPQHVFTATTFDGPVFWKAGIKGELPFAMADPNRRNGPVTRLAYSVGSIIDLPFSIAFDIFLLPLDLVPVWHIRREHGYRTRTGWCSEREAADSFKNKLAAGSRR